MQSNYFFSVLTLFYFVSGANAQRRQEDTGKTYLLLYPLNEMANTPCGTNAVYSACSPIIWQNNSQNIDKLDIILYQTQENGASRIINQTTIQSEPRIDMKKIFPTLNIAGNYEIVVKAIGVKTGTIEPMRQLVSIYFPPEIPSPIFLPNSCTGIVDFMRISFVLPIINIDTKAIENQIVRVIANPNVEIAKPVSGTTKASYRIDAYDSTGNYIENVTETKPFLVCSASATTNADVSQYVEAYEQNKRRKTQAGKSAVDNSIYKTTVKMQNDCGAEAEQSMFFTKNTVRTLEKENLPNMANVAICFPNPFDKTLNIGKVENGINESTVCTAYICDVMGKQILQAPLVASTTILDTSTLSQGVYILSIKDAQNTTLRIAKLIKTN